MPIVENAKVERTGKRGAFIVADSTGKIPNPAMVKILYDFVCQCVRTNVTRATEWKTTPLAYLAEYKKFLE